MPEFIEIGYEPIAKSSRNILIAQVHDRTVVQWAPEVATPPQADGIITNATHQEIYVFTADCLPILFYGNQQDPVAAIHSGWRGTLKGIVFQAMTQLEIPLERLHAHLGPCLMSCCFEVREDFIAAFLNEGLVIDDYLEFRNSKTYFDLPRYVVQQQLNSIPANQIDTKSLKCTYCSEPQLPSFRRNGNTDWLIRNWIRKTDR